MIYIVVNLRLFCILTQPEVGLLRAEICSLRRRTQDLQPATTLGQYTTLL